MDRRMAGAVLTLLVHAALLYAWLAARHAPDAQPDAPRMDIQWIALPVPKPAAPAVTAPDVRPRQPAPLRTGRTPPAPPAMALVPAETSATIPTPLPAEAPPAPAAPAAETILEKARRSAGSIDRALRKENRPYIVAPLDSPQKRMRAGMEQAHAMAPTKLWEAPRVDEMVNQTGDGARRSRVVTGLGTYCISERSPATSIDTIERHGKIRLTNCPQHESTATQQAWRTARD